MEFLEQARLLNRVSILVSVLWNLLGEAADEETGELSLEESRRVRRSIREWLEISDEPSSSDPYQIADFIYWNCGSAERDAAERWLASLTAKEREALVFGDLLEALQPDAADGINQLADENEAERGI